jgi:hypothetical protein
MASSFPCHLSSVICPALFACFPHPPDTWPWASLGKLSRSHLRSGAGGGDGAGASSGLEPEPRHSADSRIRREPERRLRPALPRGAAAHPRLLQDHAPAMVHRRDAIRQGSAVQLYDQLVTGLQENALEMKLTLAGGGRTAHCVSYIGYDSSKLVPTPNKACSIISLAAG